MVIKENGNKRKASYAAMFLDSIGVENIPKKYFKNS